MTADEIRAYVDELPRERLQDFVLAEIAAQLAELNDLIREWRDYRPTLQQTQDLYNAYLRARPIPDSKEEPK